jgi:hypothetical protein
VTKPALRHVHLDSSVEVTSSLSARTLHVNPVAEQFAVLPTFSREALRAVGTEVSALLDDRFACKQLMMKGRPRRLIEQLIASHDEGEFARALDLIAARLIDDERPLIGGSKTVIAKTFALCAKEGLLAFPAGELFEWRFIKGRSLPPCDARWYGEAARVVKLMESVDQSATRAKRWKEDFIEVIALRLILVVTGVREVGDFGPEVFLALRDVVSGPTFASFTGSAKKRISACLHAILRLQEQCYANDQAKILLVPRNVESLRQRLSLRVSPTYDTRFTNLTALFPEHDSWRVSAVGYVGSLEQLIATSRIVSILRIVITSLLENPDLPNTPLEFCLYAQASERTAALKQAIYQKKRLDDGKTTRDGGYVSALILHTKGYFDYVLASEARLSNGARDPRYINPADNVKPVRGQRKVQTHRKPMPAQLQAAFIRILTDPLPDPDTGTVRWTFGWAKRLKPDWFDWVNPKTGLHESIWSPIRALAVLLSLHLPLRTFQTRMLGSGEGDTEVWVPDDADPTQGRWAKNDSRWRPTGQEERYDGILRRMTVGSAEQMGMHISTNKSADHASGWESVGYDIPWASRQIQAIVGTALSFQQKYNPAIAPKSRTDLVSIRDQVTDDLVGIFRPMHYLFRDAAYPQLPDEPVGYPRLSAFWAALTDHVESESTKAGYPIKLVLNRDDHGRPTRLEYDMHSLRVTGVTRLAMNGCPIEVIAALVGHATIVMTVHYIHLDHEYIRDRLNAAFERSSVPIDGVHASWKDIATSGVVDPLSDLLVGLPDSDGEIAQLTAAQKWLVREMDIGFCPNGAVLCEEGGDTIVKNSALGDKYGPVPGLSTNCAACRFLMTGPAYLVGLAARYNALAVEIVSLREQMAACDADYAKLVDDEADCKERGDRFDHRQFIKQQELRDDAETQLMQAGERQAAVLKRVTQCVALLNKSESDGTRPKLMFDGKPVDLKHSLENSSHFDLYNRVCLDAEIFAIDSSEADRRRWKDIARMLANSAMGGVPLGLSDRELHRAGNELYKLWRVKVGGDGIQALLENRTNLAALGLADDVRAILERIAMPRVEMVPILGKRGPALLEPSKIAVASATSAA